MWLEVLDFVVRFWYVLKVEGIEFVDKLEMLCEDSEELKIILKFEVWVSWVVINWDVKYYTNGRL